MICSNCFTPIDTSKEHYVLNGQTLCGACYENFFAPPAPNEVRWSYSCQSCEAYFSTRVPSGPKQERALRCPKCLSREIRRENACLLAQAVAGG